ncbi:hypothetical protein CLU83_4083 [Flavobacterium sp. 1]|uniref:hypothetical protein n=1 Tax=Flavobacterium sp. 1 TaxID=2035200 RepID=UPI000C24E354|nr:hypothetical protein [Flavobacterium sp. 1]PJJ10632.1 hypothetical protein CLU83_4083 [Flavobacterium sp. 1]
MSVIQIDLLKKFGLSDDEINLYGTDFLLQYLKFHKTRKIGVFFSNFNNEELTTIRNVAILNNLTNLTNFSNSIDIFCVKEIFNDDLKIQEAQNFAIVLSQADFLELFTVSEYLINKNENICLNSIREEFRIVKPLSNFDFIRKVQSYSEENNAIYDVNLYKGTCSCKDYILSNRNQFVNGDLRRYCKHLRDSYNTSFSPKELKGINKYFIREKFYLKLNFGKIKIQGLDNYVYLAYNNNEGNCDFYFPTKNDSFEKYGYDYETKYFYDKPYGYATILRKELDDYFRTKRKFYIERQNSKQKKDSIKREEQNVNNVVGCFVFIIIIVSILYSLF